MLLGSAKTTPNRTGAMNMNGCGVVLGTTESAAELSFVPRTFATTLWNVVGLAGSLGAPGSDDALECLCRTYWYPLYTCVRRLGYSPEDAKDLTQEFFARLLERNSFRQADRQRGRFRSFLLTSLKHFLINEWSKAQTQKRGGHQRTFSWEELDFEGRYVREPADGSTPEKLFEKRWAVALLETVLERLRDNCAASEHRELLDALSSNLWGDAIVDCYRALATRFGLSEGAVRVAMHRLRESFRELLRKEVARTVTSPGDVDDELRQLVAALRG
jgi:RNA polymerase sigma-70 factor (ECF subfamily)